MKQLKCAELLFLISCVLVYGSSNFVNYSQKNNKTFFNMNVDDIIGNGSGSRNVDDDDCYIFTTMSLPDDPKLMPTIANGHIGFTIFSNSVYMNGLYNGHGGLSHRARIPNFANIQLAFCQTQNCTFSMNMKHGYFMATLNVENQFKATHLLYAHRLYNRAIINQFYIQRLGSKDEISLKLLKFPGNDSRDCSTSETEPAASDKAKGDLEFTKNETIRLNGCEFQFLCGHIMEPERITEEEPIQQEEDVCVLWNHVPEEITLSKTASTISYKFVMAVDKQAADVRQEMMNVFSITNDELLISHIEEWKEFWSDFSVHVDGDDELLRAIISSIFYLTCNLPSIHSNIPQHPFYGLSPTGLGRGNLNDYEGHNFWDTEIFMFPSIILMNHKWAKTLLHYRYMMLDAAHDHAKTTGYKGARFPWESASTGYETVQPGYEYIGEYQHHITGDISFALRQYFAMTNDVDWLMKEGCVMAEEIAKFWESRVEYDERSGYYSINHIMGPDEDHNDTSNNAYTNVIAIHALKFGSIAQSLCAKNARKNRWNDIADRIKIIYDESHDYHPEFEGYKIGEEVKQADTILIGYPLQFHMKESTRKNDLLIYGNSTRKSGPAMTFSMFTINFLDIGDNQNANIMLDKSYKPYIRKPFNVWSEVEEENDGAVNFITGAGGFLQTIFNGFLGIRIHIKYLEIKNPQLPKNCKMIRASGFKYLKSIFGITAFKGVTKLRFTKIKDKLNLVQSDGSSSIIYENIDYEIQPFSSVKIEKFKKFNAKFKNTHSTEK